jgi:hypothetical protein
MAASICTECVKFVDEEFPGCEELKIVALGVKRDGDSDIDAIQVCDELLSTIAEYESTTGIRGALIILHEKYNSLVRKGLAILAQKDVTRAIELFEEGKEIMLEMGFDSDDGPVFDVDSLIAQAKTYAWCG